MKMQEIYTYDKSELDKNRVIVSEIDKNDIKYLTTKSLGALQLPNTKISNGVFKITSDVTFYSKTSLATYTATIQTLRGSLIIDFSFAPRFLDFTQRTSEDVLITSKPSFVSGEYLAHKDIVVYIQILANSDERIVVIKYQ